MHHHEMRLKDRPYSCRNHTHTYPLLQTVVVLSICNKHHMTKFITTSFFLPPSQYHPLLHHHRHEQLSRCSTAVVVPPTVLLCHLHHHRPSRRVSHRCLHPEIARQISCFCCLCLQNRHHHHRHPLHRPRCYPMGYTLSLSLESLRTCHFSFVVCTRPRWRPTPTSPWRTTAAQSATRGGGFVMRVDPSCSGRKCLALRDRRAAFFLCCTRNGKFLAR